MAAFVGETWLWLNAAARDWWLDNAMSRGAAIAFYTVFSLAPTLLIVIGIAGLAFGREAVQGAVIAQITAVIGADGAAGIQSMIANAARTGSGVLATAIGVITALV